MGRLQLSADDVLGDCQTVKSIWNMYTADPEAILDKTISVRGSCYTVRQAAAGKIMFIELLDGSTVRTLQCVCDQTQVGELDWTPLWDHVSRGATVELRGSVILSPAHGQEIEFVVNSFECLGKINDAATYPLGQKGFLSRDMLRGIPHVRHQTKLFLALQIIKQTMYRSFHEGMTLCGIGEVQPTLLTSNECEEGAHPFTVTTILEDDISKIPRKMVEDKPTNEVDFSKDFFEKRVYLTVSSQLHLEATCIGTKRDGYCMTTAFRAEPSTGPLHLAEFCMPEWEIIGGGLNRNMAVAQISLQYVFKTVLEECREELAFLDGYRGKDSESELASKLSEHKKKRKSMNKKEWVAGKKAIEASVPDNSPIIPRLEKYVQTPWIVSSHEECIRLMLADVAEGKVEFKETPAYGDDFSKEHERYITEVLFGGLPVFVRYYPKDIKAFYMPIVDSGSDIEHVDCYDLLFPYVGEVVGGSQRISDHDDLVSRMEEKKMDLSMLQWYIDLRKDASLPHGGAGLGLGRLMIVMSGIFNIKDMQEFPRAFSLACNA